MNEIFRNSDLPIAAALEEISTALSSHNIAILQADPGAGKTTLVPLYLLSELLESGKKNYHAGTAEASSPDGGPTYGKYDW